MERTPERPGTNRRTLQRRVLRGVHLRVRAALVPPGAARQVRRASGGAGRGPPRRTKRGRPARGGEPGGLDGTRITIDGTTGDIALGSVPVTTEPDPYLRRLRTWEAQARQDSDGSG